MAQDFLNKKEKIINAEDCGKYIAMNVKQLNYLPDLKNVRQYIGSCSQMEGQLRS